MMDELVWRGHDVFLLARKPPGGRAGVRVCPDLADASGAWRSTVRGLDALVILAGLAHDLGRGDSSQFARYEQVNARGPERVARACADEGVRRVVFVSTIKVLGDRTDDGHRFHESSPLKPVGCYATSKALGEEFTRRALRGSGSELSIVRPPLIIGPMPKGNLHLLDMAVANHVPLPFGSRELGRRSYLSRRNLAILTSTLIDLEGPMPALIHARNDEELTAGELSELLARRRGKSAILVNMSPRLLARLGRAARKGEMVGKFCNPMQVDDSASRLATGWSPSVTLAQELAVQL